MIRLALVEDHLMFRETLKNNLEELPDFTVVEEAECGLEFEQKYDPEKVDIVLMDLRLRKQHGYITCKKLVDRFPEIKIIILSGRDDDATIISLIQQGAVGFVSKKVSFDLLMKAIREVHRYGYYFNQDVGSMMRSEMTKLLRGTRYDKNMNIHFSSTEIQIALLYCSQLNTAEIAEKMGLSVRTIENHKRAMVNRMVCRNFMGVVVYMFQNNLLYPEDVISDVTAGSTDSDLF